MIRPVFSTALSCVLFLGAAAARADDPAITESRTAAATFMATVNFVVGRLGSECLATVGRRETPQALVMAWRERNAPYFAAAQTYMLQRAQTAFESGGDEARARVVREYATAVRQNGEASVAEWFRTDSRKDGCRRALAALDAGALDVTDAAPIAGELKSLVEWAKTR